MERKNKNATQFAAGGVSDKVHIGYEHDNDTTPLKLDEARLGEILKTMSPTANQERRFIEVLGRNPNINTKHACINIACVNLSDLRQRTASVLARFGLCARCKHPPKPIKNGFGEDTAQHLWGLYRRGGDA